MKEIFTVLTILFLLNSLPAKAQDMTPPKDGAAIRLASSKIEVSSAKESVTDVWLIKSKRYVTRDFGGLQAKGPQGVIISFEPKDENKDVFSMRIKVEKGASLGKFTVMIKGEGKNSQKIKSSVISLIVSDGTIAGADED